MYKKLVMATAFVASSSMAASVTGSALSLDAGKTGSYTVDFASGGDTVTAGAMVFEFPAGVTLGTPKTTNGAFTCNTQGQKIACILAKEGGTTKIPDTTGFMSVDVTVPAGAAAGTNYTPKITKERYTGSTPSGSSLANITVKGVTPKPTTPTEPTKPTEPTTPVIPSATHPVPAVGLLGLFGMLVSLAGAASLVLRRKK